jgi:hypothetical protein
MCVCVCVSWRWFLHEPKQLSEICFDSKVLCLTKTVLITFTSNANGWTTTGYVQIWCYRIYKYGSLQWRSRFAVAAVNVVFVEDSLALGHTSVWAFLFFLSTTLPTFHLHHLSSGVCTIHPSQPTVSQTHSTRQGRPSPGRRVVWAYKFGTVASNIFRPSAWN